MRIWSKKERLLLELGKVEDTRYLPQLRSRIRQKSHEMIEALDLAVSMGCVRNDDILKLFDVLAQAMTLNGYSEISKQIIDAKNGWLETIVKKRW